MDESVVHSLAEKIGGRFHLTSIVQKRLIELNRGARPLVEPQETTLRTVIEELLQGKLDDRLGDIDLMRDDAILAPVPQRDESEV